MWVVPTTTLRDKTVPDEFAKWGQSSFFDKNVKCICYRSLYKEDSTYEHIVLDEGHNITAQNLSGPTIADNKYGSLTLMTATVPHEQSKLDLIRMMRLPLIHVMTIGDAVKAGLISTFSVRVYPVAMDKTRTHKVNLKSGSYYTSENTWYQRITAQINTYGPGMAPKAMYLRRMRGIYRFQSKVRAARKILSRIPQNKRVLIFCGSIDTARQLCEHQYHSETDNEAYEKFNNKQINRLAVVKSLNEGHNMVDVDIALIVQVDSNKRNYVQRQGRALRFRPGHKAHIVVLYSLSTKDYAWVQKSLSGIEPDFITYYQTPL